MEKQTAYEPSVQKRRKAHFRDHASDASLTHKLSCRCRLAFHKRFQFGVLLPDLLYIMVHEVPSKMTEQKLFSPLDFLTMLLQ